MISSGLTRELAPLQYGFKTFTACIIRSMEDTIVTGMDLGSLIVRMIKILHCPVDLVNHSKIEHLLFITTIHLLLQMVP